MIFLQFIVNGIAQGSIYALIATGFLLIYQLSKFLNIAQGATYLLSSYIFYYFLRVLNLPAFWGILAGLSFIILFVILTEKLFFIPLYNKNAHPGISLITSIGIYIFIVNLIALIFGNETKILNPDIEKTFTFSEIIITRIQLLQIIIAFILLPLSFIFLKFSKAGKEIRAAIDNPKLITVLGKDLTRIRITGCSIGASFISISSMLVAFDVGIDPNIGMVAILNGAVAMIVGGINSFYGAFLGGILLGIIQNIVIFFTSSRWQNAATFIILIFFLLFKPEGIFGRKKRVEE